MLTQQLVDQPSPRHCFKANALNGIGLSFQDGRSTGAEGSCPGTATEPSEPIPIDWAWAIAGAPETVTVIAAERPASRLLIRTVDLFLFALSAKRT